MTHDPTLESLLRHEVKLAGEKWVSYRSYTDAERRRLLDAMRTRREASEAFRATLQQKLKDERDDIYVPEVCAGASAFYHSTGGGRRVIRSTRGL